MIMMTAQEFVFVTISVGGTVFSLSRAMILRHDWMVAKILTSGAPFETVDGLPYLDADPVSFRLIVAILQGIMVMDLDINALSLSELALLKATARYLTCQSIHDWADRMMKDKSIIVLFDDLQSRYSDDLRYVV
jgi:hypothetical protein